MEKEHPIESATLTDKIAYINMVAQVYTPTHAREVALALGLNTKAILARHKEKIGLE